MDCRPLFLVVTPGRQADCTQFTPALEKIPYSVSITDAPGINARMPKT
ncbi:MULTISPECIES: hypothetical protein [Streptomyces]|nr:MULTISPECIES: hypothetical protein [Streptomyces]MCX5276798.1 hypothetical protein [Streptomyces virginiae]